MDRRIFGLENEYGVTCTFHGQRRLSPDEVARYLFRRVVSLGPQSATSSSRNGARLYLDVGSATPSTPRPSATTLARPRRPRQGGGADPRGPARRRRAAAARGGHRAATSTCSRTTPTPPATPTAATRTTWSAAHGEFARLADVLIPFLVTRQIIVRRRQGAADRRAAPSYCVSQRAEHIWEGVSPRDHPLAGRSSTPATSRTPTPSATAGCTSSSATRT